MKRCLIILCVLCVSVVKKWDEVELVPPAMTKRAVIQKIVASLQTELETYTRAAKASHAEATAEENRAENKYGFNSAA